MKTGKTILATVVAGTLGGTLAAATVAETAANAATMTIWSVDHSGRPPLKRHR